MTALASVGGLANHANRLRAPRQGARTHRLIALIATLVLVATTGLPWKSVARLIPQAEDHADPSIGI